MIRPESIASRLQGDDSFDTEGIVAMGESAVAPLIELTRPKNRDSMVRSRSTHILGRFSCREALDQLDVLLGDSDFSVRLAAVVALSQSRGREATLQLVRMLADTDTGVLKFTVKELDRVGDKRAIGPLKTFRDSTPHSWLRERADAAIVAIGKRGV